MNRFAFLLLLVAPPCLVSQTLKNNDLNVYITRASVLFAAGIGDFSQMDFANARAVHVDGDGEWQALKRGRGRTKDASRVGSVEVWLRWQQALDARHWVVDYDWEWIAGSSSQSNIVQVVELREGKVYITQEIEVDTHHGGHAVGAWFNAGRKRLTVKAVNYAPFEGRCCPSLMGVVTFVWDGTRFHRITAKRVPLPKDE
jgi:hypothetical protein